MVADIGAKALGSSRLRALAEMMGMILKESKVIPEEEDGGGEAEQKAAAKAKVVSSAEHERGLKVLMGIMCVKLADAGLEDENAATEELLL